MDESELPRGRPLLTAHWSNIAHLNFPVADELVAPYVPDGLELDRFDGRAWVSIVHLEFARTKALGIPAVGYRHFPEVNLRTYVRHGRERGVVFIREYVPRRVVAWMARLTYREPYMTAPVQRTINESADAIDLECRLTVGGREHAISTRGQKPPTSFSETSPEYFFDERHWGYGRSWRDETMRYEVRHPRWAIYHVPDPALDIDWGLLYGPEWAAMNGVPAAWTTIAIGSQVEVFARERVPAPIDPRPIPRPVAPPLPG